MEGAFGVHTLAILAGHVLAFVDICGVRKRWNRARAASSDTAQRRICLWRPTEMPMLQGLPLGTISSSLGPPLPQTCLLQWTSFPEKGGFRQEWDLGLAGWGSSM